MVIVILCSGIIGIHAQMPVPLFKKAPVLDMQFQDNSAHQYSIAGFFDPRTETVDTTASVSPIKQPFLEVNTDKGILSLKLSRIKKITNNAPITIDIVSGPEVKCYSLGATIQFIPDPPDWYRFGGDTPQWKSAVAAHPHFNWYYIPGATWIWNNQKLDQTSGEVVLFRQTFLILQDFAVVDAVLTITADHRIDSLFLNERLVLTETRILDGSVLHYNIGTLLNRGTNLLAVKAANDRRKDLNFAGTAWRITIRGIKKTGTASPPIAGAVAFLLNGDRVSGFLQSITPEFVALTLPYGDAQLSMDWISKLILNYSALPEIPEPEIQQSNSNIFNKILGKKTETSTTQSCHALEPFAWVAEEIFPGNLPDDFYGITLTDGSTLKGKPIGLQNNNIVVQTEYGSHNAVHVSRISEMYPTERRSPGFLKYRQEDMPYAVSVTCVNGDVLSGIIETIEPTSLTLITPYGGRIQVSYNNLIECSFMPETTLDLPQLIKEWENIRQSSFTVALMGDPIGATPRRSYEARTVYNELSRVIMECGIEPLPLSSLKFVEQGFLTPERIQLLINCDGREHYYHSILQSGDGYSALTDFINKGGNMLVMGAGCPFYYGYIAQQNQWLTTTRGEDIMNLLGFDLIVPGEFNPHARSFELPENPSMPLQFVLISAPESDLESTLLPQRIEFPTTADSRFRPVEPGEISSLDRYYPVYDLMDENGNNYGTAMAIVKRKTDTGRTQTNIYLSYQLAQSSHNGKTFLDYIIPVIIKDIIEP